MLCYFNPRSPRGERPSASVDDGWVCLFQSTLPSRGATKNVMPVYIGARDFNPRSPRGERRSMLDMTRFVELIFQSTLPSRGATSGLCGRSGKDINFNPRSPRGERLKSRSLSPTQEDFNPRSPRGERPLTEYDQINLFGFQSTLPSRGATHDKEIGSLKHRIFQSMLPSRGATKIHLSRLLGERNFNPRSPRGERR